jgi:chromosome segregation ATPase
MADTGTPEGQAPAAQTAATTTTETTTDPYAGLPAEFAWLKNDLESTRREAAARRVQLREAEDKLKEAKTPEEVAAAVADAASKSAKLEAELARERAARKHKLDDELVEFLTGTTDEQIEAQAAKLAGLKQAPAATPPAVTRQEPRGGTTPNDTTPPEINGRDAWRQYRGSR